MSRERAVVVGVGGISDSWFPPLIQEKVEVAGIVDLRLDAAKAKAQKYKLDALVGDNLPAMLRKCRPDFVVDLTVPQSHRKVTCAALSAGCHVIGEKPMASSMAEAWKMVKASKDSGKLYMVSQSRRWDAQHQRVRKTLAAGRIGEVTTINCDFYIGAHFGGFRDEMPSPLILDMSIHHFDLARFMTGTDPVAVYTKEFNPKGSWYKGDVSASCIFEMSNGVIFTYRGSWCGEGCHTSWNGDWRFIGDKGTLIYDHDKNLSGQAAAGNTGFFRALKDVKILPAPCKFPAMHGALREMLAFLRTGKQPQTVAEDNIKSLAMVFAAIESSKKGRRVPVRI